MLASVRAVLSYLTTLTSIYLQRLFLSCDQARPPCRPNPPDTRCSFDAAVRTALGGRTAGKLAFCLGPNSHGSLRFSVAVEVLTGIGSQRVLRRNARHPPSLYGGSVDRYVESRLWNKADIVPGPSVLGRDLDLRIRVQHLNQCNPRRISPRRPISFTPIPAPGGGHHHREP